MEEAKKETTEAKVQSVPSWAWIILIAICLILAISGGVKSCSKKRAEKAPPPPTAAATRKNVEALVLDNECTTPCSGNIPAGKFRIRTDGHGLRIKFKGAGLYDHPAEGEFQIPPGVETGEAQFVSSNKKNPHVKVWVYKKITVPIQ